MQSGKLSSRTLSVLAALFIFSYFLLFSYNGLSTHLSFDDGMNFIAMHHQWEVPLWRNVLDALKVFTTANRPLGALFYRPMYSLFGFDPVPYRIVIYLFLTFNIILFYRFARVLDASREGATLATLLFSYNASLFDLYYNTGTIYDVLCFSLFIGALLIYFRKRSTEGQLSYRTMAAIMLLYLASLDAKEMSVLMPAALLFYEALYHPRILKNRALALRVGSLIALTALVAAIFLKVKVTDMSANKLYHPHISIAFVLNGMGHYFEQYFYLSPGSFGPGHVAVAIVLLLAAGAALRSRPVIFGTLFFIAGLIPVAIIPPRSGYAAYVAFPGITLAVGVILASTREALVRLTGKKNLEQATMIVLFLLAAVVSVMAFAHPRKIGMTNFLWSQERVIGLMEGFKKNIPEFPPNGRILILDDPWGPDWGPMFLIRLLYHDPTVWVDRMHNDEKPGPLDSYDLLVTYKQPFIDMVPAKFFRLFKMDWEIRAVTTIEGEFTVSAPAESRAPRDIDFSPAAARTGRPVKVTVPGLSNVKIDAIYRILSNGHSTTTVASGWCTLDDKGTCMVPAPRAGQMGMLVMDWIRRPNERWIFVNGVLTVVQ
jgi:hypothetical protein